MFKDIKRIELKKMGGQGVSDNIQILLEALVNILHLEVTRLRNQYPWQFLQ